MKNQYSEKLANAAINRFRKTKTSKDLAVCVYASQLLGREPSLVLHGGGNTSVKISDKSVGDILYVKGS